MGSCTGMCMCVDLGYCVGTSGCKVSVSSCKGMGIYMCMDLCCCIGNSLCKLHGCGALWHGLTYGHETEHGRVPVTSMHILMGVGEDGSDLAAGVDMVTLAKGKGTENVPLASLFLSRIPSCFPIPHLPRARPAVRAVHFVHPHHQGLLAERRRPGGSRGGHV
eukprot:364642-Chlamydomonas_euryale.AAC.3